MRLVACPVALHPDGAPRRLAIATKPQLALVLYAIGGLETRAALLLGTSDDIVAGERWHFALCRTVPPVRAHWQNAGPDGTLQRFGWLALDDALPDGLTTPHDRALDWIRAAL